MAGTRPLDAASFYRELRDVFARNVPRYFSGSAPVAMSLTGGLDTRMIMAWQKMEPATMPCYTFGGMRRDCQDVIVARKVARACSQTHEVIPVSQEFLSKFSQYAERAVYLTDGCVDVSRATDLYLTERARQIAPVRITGNYGGEILRRVRTFKAEEPQGDVFCPEVLSRCAQNQGDSRGEYGGTPRRLRCLSTSFLGAVWNPFARANSANRSVALSR